MPRRSDASLLAGTSRHWEYRPNRSNVDSHAFLANHLVTGSRKNCLCIEDMRSVPFKRTGRMTKGEHDDRNHCATRPRGFGTRNSTRTRTLSRPSHSGRWRTSVDLWNGRGSDVKWTSDQSAVLSRGSLG